MTTAPIPTPKTLNPRIAALAGNMPDGVITAISGVPEYIIARYRKLHGIPRYKASTEIRPIKTVVKMSAQGMTDAEISAQTGLSEHSIDMCLIHAGARKIDVEKVPHVWESSLIEFVKNSGLLATMKDNEVAAELGVSASMVSDARAALGLQAPPRFDKAGITEFLEQNPEASNAEVMEAVGCGVKAVTRVRAELGAPGRPTTPEGVWTPEVVALLGTVSDQKLADDLGLTLSIVSRKRRSLGITSKFSENRTGEARNYVKEHGPVPARQLAEMFGMSLATAYVVLNELKNSSPP